MPTIQFTTPEVAELYDQFRGWDHPEYPFRDPNYSPGGYAPATDFTPYVAAWIGQGREDAIAELWRFLTPDSDASRFALRKAIAARLPSDVHMAEWQTQELRAIYLLTFRATLIHPPQHQGYVARQLAATTLACAPIRIENHAVDRLIRVSKSEVLDTSPNGGTGCENESAAFSLEKAQTDLGPEAATVDRFKSVPPMSRVVVHDFLTRDWGQGMLRFSLYYDERMYGCSTELNQHYVNSLEFFQPPDDTARVPAGVTKQMISDGLSARGVAFKRSESRAMLLEKARHERGLLSSLVLKAYPCQQELRPEWSTPVREWSQRVRAVEVLASALIKLLGSSELRLKI